MNVPSGEAPRRELAKAIAGLMRAGVSIEDANRLLDVAARSERMVLILVALPGIPRPGETVRRRLAGGAEEALRVIEAAPGDMVRVRSAVGLLADPYEQRWAVVGEPVTPSSRDDVLVGR